MLDKLLHHLSIALSYLLLYALEEHRMFLQDPRVLGTTLSDGMGLRASTEPLFLTQAAERALGSSQIKFRRLKQW